jgi:aldose 1-epimerase
VVYEVTDDNALKISYHALTDKKTVLKPNNHAFFNLNGEAGGTILKHLIKVNADQYTTVDTTDLQFL